MYRRLVTFSKIILSLEKMETLCSKEQTRESEQNSVCTIQT